jgi:predicted NAD/FAD-dependent oxidoreductase
MLQVSERIQTPFDAAFVHDSPLSWIARNSNKPERHGAEGWVLHASAAWSRTHLEDSAEVIAKTLVEEFWHAIAQSPQPLEFVIAHRWRYALPQEPLPHRYVLDPNLNLAACGDWCGGPRVEGAFLSGLALGEAVRKMNDTG